jgi:hypothetical protein
MHKKVCPACDRWFYASSDEAALILVKNHLRLWTDEGDELHAGITALEGWEEQPFDPT